MQATIGSSIPVRHSVRPDVGREFLTVDLPDGWDSAKALLHRVLIYDGREFVWTGWNSDRNEAFFARALDGSWPTTATISNRKRI